MHAYACILVDHVKLSKGGSKHPYLILKPTYCRWVIYNHMPWPIKRGEIWWNLSFYIIYVFCIIYIYIYITLLYIYIYIYIHYYHYYYYHIYILLLISINWISIMQFHPLGPLDLGLRTAADAPPRALATGREAPPEPWALDGGEGKALPLAIAHQKSYIAYAAAIENTYPLAI